MDSEQPGLDPHSETPLTSAEAKGESSMPPADEDNVEAGGAEAAGSDVVGDGIVGDGIEDAAGGSDDTAATETAAKPKRARKPKVEAVAVEEQVPPEDLQWYVLKVQSNREKSIRDAIMRRARQDGLEIFFGQIVIPVEKVVENKNGKKRTVEQKLYPGYLMIQMSLTDDTWYLVRSTSGVGDFTGTGGKPLPMEAQEIERMLGHQQQAKEEVPSKVKMNFHAGDTVKIMEGTFESFEGVIEAIDDASGKINVLINIFGRPTPLELWYWQVEKQ